MPSSLPVHERFDTFQGEGCHTGSAAHFIRLFGCPIHCPWCDSAGTWHQDYRPGEIERIQPEALALEASRTRAEFTVITGGEPCIHDLRALTEALHAIGQKIHLETSGAFPIRGEFDWITLSPKRWQLPLAENIELAHEFKIIVDRPDAIGEYCQRLTRKHIPVWLHPEWSQHNNSAILNAITGWVKKQGAPYRAGWQIHKNYDADRCDSRSLPPAPLGGNPDIGF